MMRCNHSLPTLLQKVYPEYPWLPWLFKEEPTDIWKNEENRAMYFRWLEDKLKVKDKMDWYKIKSSDIMQLPGGNSFMKYYDNMVNLMVQEAYPNGNWHPWLFEERCQQVFIQCKISI
jgi:hypothetical protein